MKSKQNQSYSIKQNQTYANIIKSVGFVNILIPVLITVMFLMFTGMFRIDMSDVNNIAILCAFYGIWLLLYISLGVWMTLIIRRNNWFIGSLEKSKNTYWICSLIFTIIPIGLVGAALWIAWGNKAMKATEEYRKFGDPKYKEENQKYFDDLNREFDEEIETELELLELELIE